MFLVTIKIVHILLTSTVRIGPTIIIITTTTTTTTTTTNEKIEVMLSRKRCRGTLQDYNKGEISKCQSKLWTNSNVFSWCQNGTREETVRRDGDRLFHARGAATGKHDHLW